MLTWPGMRVTEKRLPSDFMNVGAGALAVAVAQKQSVADSTATPEKKEIEANKKYNGPTAYGFSFKYPEAWKASKVEPIPKTMA
jgi:hypothetical protein